MIAKLLTQQIVVLFMIIGCGFLITKLGFVKTEDAKPLSMLIVHMILPCGILNGFLSGYTPEIRNGFLLALVTAIIIHVLLILLCRALNTCYSITDVERASLIYTNSGNLIFPLVASVLGSEWVIYAAAFLCVQILFQWSHGLSLLSGTKLIDIKKILCNVNMIAAEIGIVVFFGRIPMPTILRSFIGATGASLGPMSMLTLGIMLAAVDWKSVLSSRRIYVLTALKMIVFPLILLLFLKYGGLAKLLPDGKGILLVSLLAVVAPSATTVAQIAQIYDRDAPYAGTINVATTLVSIVTMPLMILLYTM